MAFSNIYELPKANRKCWDKFIPKDLNREIRIVESLPEDESVIRKYVKYEAIPCMPITKTFKLSDDEIEEMIEFRFSRQKMSKAVIILAMDGDYLCGMMMNLTVDVEKRDFDYEMPVDFFELASKISYKSENLRAFAAAVNWILQWSFKFLPSDCEKFVRTEMASVHSNYRGKEILYRLGNGSLMSAAMNKVMIIETLATSKIGGHVALNSGLAPLHVFRYTDFYYKGRPIFPNGCLSDGATEALLFQANISNIMVNTEVEDSSEITTELKAKI